MSFIKHDTLNELKTNGFYHENLPLAYGGNTTIYDRTLVVHNAQIVDEVRITHTNHVKPVLSIRRELDMNGRLHGWVKTVRRDEGGTTTRSAFFENGACMQQTETDPDRQNKLKRILRRAKKAHGL